MSLQGRNPDTSPRDLWRRLSGSGRTGRSADERIARGVSQVRAEPAPAAGLAATLEALGLNSPASRERAPAATLPAPAARRTRLSLARWALALTVPLALVSVLLASVLPLHDRPRLQGVDAYFLLPFPTVQAELGMTEQQQQRREAAVAAQQEQLERLKALPPAQWKSRQAQLEQETRKRLLGILTPEQMERLGQIELQVVGGAAFVRQEVVRELDLLPEQRRRIEAIVAALCIDEERLVPRLRDSADLRELVEVRQRAYEEAVAVLTPQQQARWREIIGAPFELKALIVNATAPRM